MKLYLFFDFCKINHWYKYELSKTDANTLDTFLDEIPENTIEISFDEGPKVEVIGPHKNDYKIEFVNKW